MKFVCFFLFETLVTDFKFPEPASIFGKNKTHVWVFQTWGGPQGGGRGISGPQTLVFPVVWSSRSYTSNEEEPRTPRSAKKREWVRREFPSNDTSHYNYEDATEGPQQSTVIRWMQGSGRVGIPRLALKETESCSRTPHTVVPLRSQWRRGSNGSKRPGARGRSRKQSSWTLKSVRKILIDKQVKN